MTYKQELCIKCQKCCKRIGIHTAYSTLDADAINFLKIRGFDVVLDKQGFIRAEMDLLCPHLTEKGCNIYKGRPKACVDFDGRKEFGEKCLWTLIKGE